MAHVEDAMGADGPVLGDVQDVRMFGTCMLKTFMWRYHEWTWDEHTSQVPVA